MFLVCAAVAPYPVSLLLFGAIALGTPSLLCSDGFCRGAVLNKAYRLALFIVMSGYLLIPVPQFTELIMSGEAVILAGHLGLSEGSSLFLALVKLAGTDAALFFSREFVALSGGELIGVCIANVFDCAQPDYVTPDSFVVFAGLLVLFYYVFLFTERDFRNLSEIVTSTDSLENACVAIAQAFGLFDCDGETLPFASGVARANVFRRSCIFPRAPSTCICGASMRNRGFTAARSLSIWARKSGIKRR